MIKLLNELKSILNRNILEEKLIKIVISGKKDKNNEINKIDLDRFISKEDTIYQLSYIYKNKVTHKNLVGENINIEIIEEYINNYKQMMIFTEEADYQVLNNKNIKIIKSKPSKENSIKNHNRTKNYLLQDGEEIPFLEKLGVMDKNYKVKNDKYDKFKQINRYLEIFNNIFPQIENNDKINIVDFGCGKAYLSFALYYFLNIIKGKEINIIRLDLKEDVIDYCNNIAKNLNYKDLNFCKGDIKGYKTDLNIDAVITLHACDIATDEAILQALSWETKVIIVVPCCQHELFSQINNEIMEPMLKFGLFKEKISSTVTDSIRAQILEIMGYEVSVIEFIDSTHTPKNTMIRAVYRGISIEEKKSKIEAYYKFKNIWGIDPYIEKKLNLESIVSI